MAEERNSENFALGIIVAAIVFLLLRREMNRGKEITEPGTNAEVSASVPTCGCGGGENTSAWQSPATNPGVSLGGQSYNILPFTASSVTPAMKNSPAPDKQWRTHA